MTIYDAPSAEASFLVAKERAPGAANVTMFRGNATLSFAGLLSLSSITEMSGIIIPLVLQEGWQLRSPASF